MRVVLLMRVLQSRGWLGELGGRAVLPVMTRADRLRVAESCRFVEAMVRSDYRPRQRHVRAPRPASPHLHLPVRRPLGRAGTAPHAHAERRGRGQPRGAAGRRARLGQEPPGARVRRRGGGGRRARALRRLRRRGAHALRAVRRGARPAGAGHRARRAARPRWAAAAASSPGSSPTSAPAWAVSRPRWRPTRTPSATGCTRPWPTCWPASPGRRPALLVLEDVHWADAPTLLLLRHLARAGSARDPAARHLPGHRGRRARRALGDARGPAPLRHRPARPRRALGRRGGRVRAERRRGGPRPASCASWRGAIRELTDGNAFLVCELWRALVETGAVEVVGGSIQVTRSPAELGSPESVREVVSQRLSRLAPGTSDLLELAATAGAEFELDVVRRAAGLGEPELLAALDEAVRSGMIEELPSQRAGVPVHPRARAAGAVRPAVGSAAGGASPARGRGARARPRPLGAGARGPRASLRRRGALRWDRRAPSSTTCSPRGRPPRRSPSTRRRRGCAPRSRWGSTARRSAWSSRSSSGRRATAAGRRSMRWRRSGRPRTSPGSWGTRSGLARAAIGYEDACWRPGMTDQGAVELLEEAATALGDEDSGLRVGLLGGLARALDFQGQHERGAIVRTNAIDDGAAAGGPASASPPCWCAPTGRAAPPRSRRSSPCSPRPGTSARSWATPRSARRRCPGGCRRSSRSPTSSRRGARWPRCSRRPSRPRSRSSSTWPSTTGRRSRSATGAWRRPRRGPGARTSGAAC